MPRSRDCDQHHIYPSSAFPHLKGELWNLKYINKKRHAHWHALVNNMPPLAALVMLFNEFLPHDKRHLLEDPALEAFRDLFKLLPEVEDDEE